MTPAWKQFAADFDSMTDDQINQETRRCEDMLDEAEAWLEAVQSWRDAGCPRSEAA